VRRRMQEPKDDASEQVELGALSERTPVGYLVKNGGAITHAGGRHEPQQDV
jgi:hypothetical protein